MKEKNHGECEAGKHYSFQRPREYQRTPRPVHNRNSTVVVLLSMNIDHVTSQHATAALVMGR